MLAVPRPRLAWPHFTLMLVILPLGAPQPARAATPRDTTGPRVVCSEVAVVAAHVTVRREAAAGPEALGSPPAVGR